MAHKPYTLKELADFITPGMLGLQYTNGSLLFKPKREFDPRLNSLEDNGWFKIKGCETPVLSAASTLEAYYTLVESGLEFEATAKVKNWLNRIYNYSDCLDPYQWDRLEKSPLFDYQKDAAEFLASKARAMLALSPGLGKSLVAAFAAGLVDRKTVLLVSPASLMYTWKKELEKWSGQLPLQPEIEIWHRKIGIAPKGEDVVRDSQFWAIINPETLVKYADSFFIDNYWEQLIVDESSMYKHRTSQRSKQVKRVAESIDNVWLLTGTPATRYLDDMWHQFHILKPKAYKSYWQFTERYCVVQADEWAKTVVANRRYAENNIKNNFLDIYFSRNQDDVLDIPDWLFVDMDIPMLPKQDKVYGRLRKELTIALSEVDPTQVIGVDNHLSLVIRSLQVASNPILVDAVDEGGKWQVLPELMELYPGPFLIWVNYIKTGELLRDRLSQMGKITCLVNGSTPMSDRSMMVDAFQRGETDVLIMNNQVGKFGFTITKARTAIFVERGYDDSYFQCLHRNRRIGTTESPVIINLRSVMRDGKKTIDHVVHDVLDYRTGMLKAITTKTLLDVMGDR